MNQQPAVFTTKVADAQQAVTELEAFCTAQETKTTGAAEQKGREATEAEEVAFQMGRALVEWFRDQGDETNAAKVDLSRSKWHGLRDQSFNDQLATTLSLAQGVTGGAQAAAAVGYGITAANVTVLAKEIKDYADEMAAPQAGIADRKALTGQMRAKFNAVEAKFATLDNLILQFNGTAAGRALVAAYQASRVVRDLGAGPGPKPPAPPP